MLTTLLCVLAVTSLPAQTPATAAQVTAIVERAFERFAPVGLAVAVVQDGEVLVELGRGKLCSTGEAQMTAHSLCNIASCTKAFTAAAILLLAQEGKLALDDRVVTHLPEFRLADPWITQQMTVRDLLSHRCGLATFAGDLLWYGSDHEEAEVLRRLAKLPITRQFRSEFGYQNLMYLVAGMIVERRSGKSWEEFIEQHLLAKLGMQHSRAAAQRLPEGAEKAIPHIDGEPIADHEFCAAKAAASIYSSAHELAAWIRLNLEAGKAGGLVLLQPASFAEMWRPHIHIGGGSGANTNDLRSYGLGWFLSLEGAQKLVEHDGGMPGFLSKVTLLPASRFGFCVLNNNNDGVLNEAIKRALLALRRGDDGLAVIDQLAKARERMKARAASTTEQRERKRLANTSPRLPLGEYAGDYEDQIYGRAKIILEGERLHLTLVPGRRRLHGTLRHWHHDSFRVDFPDKFLPFALVRFDFDHHGAVRGFAIDCPIDDFDFAALDFVRQDR
jgi:CubicO group peptidase (beta-lactamase class C family)